LDKYPRTLEKDMELLSDFGDRLSIYNPDISVMYPDNQNVDVVNYGYLTSALEAEFRPGHFDGMVDIVRRLFNHVQPDVAFFGQKDYQQLAIIRKLVRDEDLPLGIVGCPIIRETDGLALSSRNVRLSEAERKIALNLNLALKNIKKYANDKALPDLLDETKKQYFSNDDIRLEYMECVDAQTLEICDSWNDALDIVCCIAAYVGDIRLIDNMLVKP
jgi:pantoate--beta-alanine ligase